MIKYIEEQCDFAFSHLDYWEVIYIGVVTVAMSEWLEGN